MTTPTRTLIDLLATPESRDWQSRLTAAFFQPDARRAILDDLRTWLATQNADAIADDFLGRLLAIASRQATPPDANSAPLLTGPDLEDRIITTYPYPIATPFRALTEQESAAAAFGCLLDTFEAIVHYLASVAVSAYLRSSLSDTDGNRQLIERLSKDKWAVGDLWAILRDTVRRGGDWHRRLPYQALPDHLFTPTGDLTRSALVLESFVALRNRVWGHATGREESFFSEILPANRARLEEELARMSWLAEGELVRPLVMDEAGNITRVDILRGERRLRSRPYQLHLAAEDLADVRVERSVLLVSADRTCALPLFPLALFHFHLRSQGVYFLQRPQWKREGGQRRLRKAGYVAYESGLGEYEEGPGDPAALSLEQHVQRLEAQLGTPLAFPTVPGEDPECELPEVRQELEFHRRTFAGRDDLLRRVAGWLGASDDGGYLVLLGPPGQGKSALLAEVSRRASEKHGCVVHLIKSHRSPLRFLPALVRQAARIANKRFGPEAYRGDVDDLRNALVQALEAVRDTRGKAVLVLDALDELDSRHERLAFLPEQLPRGVRVVLSCRPDIPLVHALRARLRKLDEWPLRALSQDDLFPLLRRRLSAEWPDEDIEPRMARLSDALDWPALFERLQGNPLFLQRALDQAVRTLREAPTNTPLPLSQASFPSTLEALFQAIHAEIAEKDGATYRRPEGRVKSRLLQLLCLAREPLGFEALQALLAADGLPLSLEDCRDRVHEMSRYLLEPAGQRFKPWHQGLSDHVRTTVLGVEGCRQVEGLFAAWLRRPEHERGLYALRHRIRHLLGASLLDEAATLLLDRRFVERRAEEEPIYDLVADYAEVQRLLPGSHAHQHLLRLIEEALRTDLHFLVRRPEALFQCLYNRGWWYDHPDSARHYQPQDGVVPPWETSRIRLCDLLDVWRREKEEESPGLRWVRSLRPPEVHLGTAQRMVFRGHQAGATSVVVLEGSERLASGSDDATVRIWDLVGGEELMCLSGHRDKVNALAASPDARWLVSASNDRTMRLWDAHDGRELLVLAEHRAPVNSATFSLDGTLLVSCGDDRSVRLWESSTGRHLAVLRGHRRWVMSVAFAPDGQMVASGSGDGTIQLWDIAKERSVARISAPGPVNAVVFAPDGRRLVYGGDDGAIHVVDLDTLQEVGCWTGHYRSVRTLCFAACGRWLVSAGDDRNVNVWDVATGQRRAVLAGHEVTVRAVAALDDRMQIVSAAGDATLRLWEPSGGGTLLRRQGHSNWVTCVAFSPDGRLLASGGGDKCVQIMSVSGDRRMMLTGHTDRVWSLAFAPTGMLLATGSRDRTVRLWDVDRGETVRVLDGPQDAVRGVAFSPDGLRIAAGSKDGQVWIWDAQTGSVLGSFGSERSCVVCVAFSPEGARLAAGHLSGVTVVFDLRTGEVLRRLESQTEEDDDVDGLAFSPDGTRLVTHSLHWRVRVWDVASGEVLRQYPGTADARSVAAGWPQFPWLALGQRWETVLQPMRGGDPIAWLPGTLHRLTSHPHGRIWAATHSRQVEVFTLEGG